MSAHHCGHYTVLQISASVHSSLSDFLAPTGSKYELGAHPSLSPWLTSHQPKHIGARFSLKFAMVLITTIQVSNYQHLYNSDSNIYIILYKKYRYSYTKFVMVFCTNTSIQIIFSSLYLTISILLHNNDSGTLLQADLPEVVR